MNAPSNQDAGVFMPDGIAATIAADLATMARDLDAAVNKTPKERPILADAVAEALHWIRNKRKGEATAQRTIAHLQGRVDNLVAKVEALKAEKGGAAMVDRVEVDAVALRAVLVALNGQGHEIRELQALRGPLWPDSPIDKLTEEFNAWARAQNEGGGNG